MIWNSNNHKYFTLPSQGIWQWLVLKTQNTPTSKEKVSSNCKVYFFITKQHKVFLPNQISSPKQWWRSIHHQSNDQNLEMYGDGMFSIAICVVIENFQSSTLQITHTHTHMHTKNKSTNIWNLLPPLGS